MAFTALNGSKDSDVSSIDVSSIDIAFAQKPNLKKRVHECIGKYPSLTGLFSDVSSYIRELQSRSAEVVANGSSPKKRKLNGDETNGHEETARKNGADTGILNAGWTTEPIEGISFSIPQRKKLLLQVSPEKKEGIRALNPGTKSKEFGVLWKDIEHIACLPVPEKAQAAWNFCIFPRYADGVSNPPDGLLVPEPIVWTITESKAKDAEEGMPNPKDTIIRAISQNHKSILEPSAKEFASEVQQAQRKGEKAYHVKAFRGSKDGYLFFLSSGIIWAFKKPLCFFSFAHIDSVSYTSVLQRTFNLNFTIRTDSTQDSQEFEFSMIDQADFGGIDGYVKRHGLQDASMAEQRRAKKLNINGVKGEEEGGEEQEGELEKARREVEAQALAQVDDDEDEEEDENFDPGSEGESEGSGTSDEEEEEGCGGET